MELEEQQTTMINDVAVHYPQTNSLSEENIDCIKGIIESTQKSFEQKIWKIWLEPDQKERVKYHHFQIVFDIREGKQHIKRTVGEMR